MRLVWSVTVKTIYGDAGPGLSKYSVSMIDIVAIKSIVNSRVTVRPVCRKKDPQNRHSKININQLDYYSNVHTSLNCSQEVFEK